MKFLLNHFIQYSASVKRGAYCDTLFGIILVHHIHSTLILPVVFAVSKKIKCPNTKEKTKFLELILKSTKTSANIDVLLNVSLILVMSMKFYFSQQKVIHETKEHLLHALNTET